MIFACTCTLHRFDLDWLRNPDHRHRNKIEVDNSLGPKEKLYFQGVLTRQGDAMLPRGPSQEDRKFLMSLYGK